MRHLKIISPHSRLQLRRFRLARLRSPAPTRRARGNARSAADNVKLDESRKPAQVLEFLGSSRG